MPLKYQIQLNQGNEALNTGKSITVNEVVETVDEKALAREIHHLNSLIPEQVAASVLENFCQAAAQLMAMGYAVQLKNGNEVALRIYPDIHLKDGNINLQKAQSIDPTITDLTLENAGELVSRVGITVRAKAECEQKFTDLLKAQGASLNRAGIVEKAYVPRNQNASEPSTPSGGGDNSGVNGE